jgi:hypothetical protein
MSLPQVQLVDSHGTPIDADDCGDAAAWPASNDVDGWYWEVEPDERAALEQAAFDEECERRDQIDDSVRWHEMMAAGLPTDAELAQLAAHGAI